MPPSIYDTRIVIVVDTREQTPWAFPAEYVRLISHKLDAGDYALHNDHEFAIERKSLSDFLGTVSSGWERFLREIERMGKYCAKVVIVEGDFAHTCFQQSETGEIIEPCHNHPMLTPQFIASRVAELTMMGVSVLFAGDASQAAALALHIFRKRQLQLMNSKG